MSQKTPTQTTTNNGIGFFGLLAVLFIGLKLAGVGVVATWSWWWVLSPLWIPLAIVIVIAAIAFIIWGIVQLSKK